MWNAFPETVASSLFKQFKKKIWLTLLLNMFLWRCWSGTPAGVMHTMMMIIQCAWWKSLGTRQRCTCLTSECNPLSTSKLFSCNAAIHICTIILWSWLQPHLPSGLLYKCVFVFHRKRTMLWRQCQCLKLVGSLKLELYRGKDGMVYCWSLNLFCYYDFVILFLFVSKEVLQFQVNFKRLMAYWVAVLNIKIVDT